MDWRHVLFAIGQGAPAIIALVICVPALAFLARSHRKLWATSSPITALLGFGLASVLAGIPDIEAIKLAGYFPFVFLVGTVGLIAPSVCALERRWTGVIHVVTVTSTIYLWFVASLAISHDGT